MDRTSGGEMTWKEVISPSDSQVRELGLRTALTWYRSTLRRCLNNLGRNTLEQALYVMKKLQKEKEHNLLSISRS